MLDMSGRLDEAVALTRAAVDLDPENVLARRGLGRLYAFAGLPDSAVAQFERAFSIDSTIFGGRTNLMFGYAAAGRWDDVARQRALLARERVGNSPNYYRMMVSLVYGQTADAMTALERGVANREPLLGNMSLPCDPILDPLKADPRFAVLMAKLGARPCLPSRRWPIGPPPR
jgi:tetratricopeptide (TPR) repeat protein